MKKSNQRSYKAACFVALCAFSAFYFAGIYAIRHDAISVLDVRDQMVSNELVKKAIENHLLYESAFFQKAATKLEYVGHDPSVLRLAYQLSVMKAPGNSENLFSFGSYKASLNQLDQAEKLFQEAIRRFSTNSRLAASAGITLFRAGDRKGSIPFLKHALLVEPELSREIYPILGKYSVPFDDLVAITPNEPECMVRLCQYLASKTHTNEQLFAIIQQVASMDLKPEQKLKIAATATEAGFFSLARMEAEELLNHSELGPKAVELLAEINRVEKKRKRHPESENRMN
jgi:tetratricopeptide (TPR) repeat protein